MSQRHEPVPCARCGYSREGRAWNSACPECGEEVPRGFPPGKRQAAHAKTLFVVGTCTSLLAGCWHPLLGVFACVLVAGSCLAWSASILWKIQRNDWTAQGRNDAAFVFWLSLALVFASITLGPVLSLRALG